MQISERDRPYSDGYWCGDGEGFNIYYSETGSVTITLKQFIPMEYIHFEVRIAWSTYISRFSERDRPYSDGYWCGDGEGFNIYYSGTGSVTITLKQFIPMEYIHLEVRIESINYYNYYV